MRVGGVLFAVGVLAIVATVVPLLVGSSRLPTAAYLVAMLAPLGMGLALVGLLRAARSRRRRPDPSELDLDLPL